MLVRENFQSNTYHLLPFRTSKFDENKWIIVNDVGEFSILPDAEMEALINKQLHPSSPYYQELFTKSFICSEFNSVVQRVLASKYKTKKHFIDGFSKLHIFVPTLRCNHSCGYCQVSRGNITDSGMDMSDEIATKAIDLMLKCPSNTITMEFQGGEPLLQFTLLKKMVRYAQLINNSKKDLRFVVCTNLSLLTKEHLNFFKENNIYISTSLDGPKELHEKNRPCKNIESYDVTIDNIRRIQDFLGMDYVSALMTTTRWSLLYFREIIDQYLDLKLQSIFIRNLNPYGYAIKTNKSLGYTNQEFLNFYKQCFNYIIQKNMEGYFFPEATAALIYRKILTPYSIGFVDLQSPTGEGFGTTLYNYDGNVYPSDEARMLAEMGDKTFSMGNVLTNNYAEIFFGDVMQMIAATGCNESLPGCAECVYQPYCGADPIRHYATQGDLIGFRSTSTYCQKNKSIIDFLVKKLITDNTDTSYNNIIWSWIN